MYQALCLYMFYIKQTHAVSLFIIYNNKDLLIACIHCYLSRDTSCHFSSRNLNYLSFIIQLYIYVVILYNKTISQTSTCCNTIIGKHVLNFFMRMKWLAWNNLARVSKLLAFLLYLYAVIATNYPALYLLF